MIDLTTAKRVKINSGRGITEVLTIDERYPRPSLSKLDSGKEAWMFHASSDLTGNTQVPYGIDPKLIVEVIEWITGQPAL